MFELLRRSLGYRRAEESQMHGCIGVCVFCFGKDAPEQERDAEFLTAFADKGLFLTLAGLYLASGEFPQPSARLVRGPPADHEFISAANQRGYDFDHKNPSAFPHGGESAAMRR
nr:hypothetical protein [Synergistes jonesii]